MSNSQGIRTIRSRCPLPNVRTCPTKQVWREERRKYDRMDNMMRSVQRWFICGVIGFLTGLFAFIVDTCITHLARWKVSRAHALSPCV